mgnify:CR=1 FL=1
MAESLLAALRETADVFLPEIPQVPQGRYAHFVLVRETESFPVFQTDGSLNVIRVQAGLGLVRDARVISRLVLFKRKQSSPERLTGRELLRRYGIISDSGELACEYNSERFCKRCPDCILYGYAIGNEGAEKSKVYVDSAFSVSPYEESHKAFSFNALYEHGTMTRGGETRASFGEQDHVVPQVFFPSVVTLRDTTYEGFLYVLGNLLRTDRYGAQDTRTGKMTNHLVAVVFGDAEIFSNLRLTQAMYDYIQEEDRWSEPLERQAVLEACCESYHTLIAQEPIAKTFELSGSLAADFAAEVTALYQDARWTAELLRTLAAATAKYADDCKAATSRRGR